MKWTFNHTSTSIVTICTVILLPILLPHLTPTTSIELLFILILLRQQNSHGLDFSNEMLYLALTGIEMFTQIIILMFKHILLEDELINLTDLLDALIDKSFLHTHILLHLLTFLGHLVELVLDIIYLLL